MCAASQKKLLAELDSTETNGVTVLTASDEAANKLFELGMYVLLLKMFLRAHIHV